MYNRYRSRKTTENDSSMVGFAVVPYIHRVTEPIKRILCSYNVKVAQKPFLTLNHIFAKPKAGSCAERTKIRRYIFHPVQ